MQKAWRSIIAPPLVIFIITCCLPVINLHAQTWTKKNDIPPSTVSGRWGAYSFTLNGKIYLGGGYTGNQVNLNDLWEYDPATDSWTQKADVPGSQGRTYAVAFAINGKGYIGLGVEGYNSINSKFLDDLWEYDPVANTWSQKQSLNDSARGSASCFVINNKAYIVGGAPDYSLISNDVWRYDPGQNMWDSMTPCPVAHMSSASFSIGSKGYVVGGQKNTGTGLATLKETYEYDPVVNTWTKRADYCDTLGRNNAVSFVINNKAYVGLGEAKSGATTYYFKEFCTYDPTSNQWSPALAFPGADRTYSVASVVNGKAYAGAGFYHLGSEVYLKDWYEFEPGSTGMDALNKTSVLVYPNPATGQIFVRVPDASEPLTYEIKNIIGRNVMSGVTKNSLSLNIEQLTPGYYIFKIISEEGILTQPFLVK